MMRHPPFVSAHSHTLLSALGSMPQSRRLKKSSLNKLNNSIKRLLHIIAGGDPHNNMTGSLPNDSTEKPLKSHLCTKSYHPQ